MAKRKIWFWLSFSAVVVLCLGAYWSGDPLSKYGTDVLVQLAVIVLGVPAALFIHNLTRRHEEEQEEQRKTQELALILTDLHKSIEANTSKVQNVMNEMNRDDSLMDSTWSELDDTPWLTTRDRLLFLCNDPDLKVSMYRFYNHVTQALRFLDQRFMCRVESWHVKSSEEKGKMVRIYANHVDKHCRRIQAMGPELQKRIQGRLK